MKKPRHHIFVCCSFRAGGGEPQGICHKKDSMQLMQYLEGELNDRGMGDILVSSTGCLKVCDRGPAMVIYPENWWYGMVENESVIDEILDALEDGVPAQKYIIAD